MTIQASTLRPGLLVGLKTSVVGNVKYSKVVIAPDQETEEGALIGKWETERTISDRKEHEEAIKVRAKARNTVTAVCAQSAFGLLCPEANAPILEAAVAEARKLADEFNAKARLTRIHVYVIAGRIAADDAEAVRALNFEISGLLSTIETGLRNLDVKTVREAANRARNVGRILSPQAQERVNVAITAAREAAKKIIKASEVGAAEIDLIAIEAVQKSRTAFLDLDEASEIAAPVAEARAVDLVPEHREAGFEPGVTDPVPTRPTYIAPQIEI